MLATTSPLDLVAPLADALGFDDVIATRYARARRPVHRAARRRLRLGTGKAGGRGPVGRRPRRRPGGVARLHRQRLRPTAAAGSRASPPAQRRPPAGGRGPGPTLAPRALGPPAGHPLGDRLRALPPDSPVLPARGVPVRPFRHQRHWSTSRPAGRCCWPPITAATSMWPPSAWWPPDWGARSASWPSRRCSTRPWWAASPDPSAASPSNGGPARPSPCDGRRRPCGPAKWSSSYPRGPFPAGEAFFDPVLRRSHRDGPPGRRDRCPCRARWPVGDRAGLAAIVEGARS